MECASQNDQNLPWDFHSISISCSTLLVLSPQIRRLQVLPLSLHNKYIILDEIQGTNTTQNVLSSLKPIQVTKVFTTFSSYKNMFPAIQSRTLFVYNTIWHSITLLIGAT